MFAMLFVTPAKARCSNGDREYVTMFLPFVNEPNFLPIVNQTKGKHQRQSKRSQQCPIWRLPKRLVNALRAMGLVFSYSRTRPEFTDNFRLLLTVVYGCDCGLAGSCYFTYSKFSAFRTDKGHFIQICFCGLMLWEIIR